MPRRPRGTFGPAGNEALKPQQEAAVPSRARCPGSRAQATRQGLPSRMGARCQGPGGLRRASAGDQRLWPVPCPTLLQWSPVGSRNLSWGRFQGSPWTARQAGLGCGQGDEGGALSTQESVAASQAGPHWGQVGPALRGPRRASTVRRQLPGVENPRACMERERSSPARTLLSHQRGRTQGTDPSAGPSISDVAQGKCLTSLSSSARSREI